MDRLLLGAPTQLVTSGKQCSETQVYFFFFKEKAKVWLQNDSLLPRSLVRARPQPTFHSDHFSGHCETQNCHGRDGEKMGWGWRTDAGKASGEGD